MNPETTQRSLQAALPALLGALQRNASRLAAPKHCIRPSCVITPMPTRWRA
jgi:hypothetical protein